MLAIGLFFWPQFDQSGTFEGQRSCSQNSFSSFSPTMVGWSSQPETLLVITQLINQPLCLQIQIYLHHCHQAATQAKISLRIVTSFNHPFFSSLSASPLTISASNLEVMNSQISSGAFGQNKVAFPDERKRSHPLPRQKVFISNRTIRTCSLEPPFQMFT